MVFSASGSIPWAKGWCARMSSRPTILTMICLPPELPQSFACDGGRRVAADRADLFGDIDANRAPRDAAAAADAAGCAELFDPACQFVGHPLPVARARRGPHRTAMDVGEILREAGIPAPRPLGRPRQFVGVGDGGAEAGRADLRAVAAGQAPGGDV